MKDRYKQYVQRKKEKYKEEVTRFLGAVKEKARTGYNGTLLDEFNDLCDATQWVSVKEAADIFYREAIVRDAQNEAMDEIKERAGKGGTYLGGHAHGAERLIGGLAAMDQDLKGILLRGVDEELGGFKPSKRGYGR